MKFKTGDFVTFDTETVPNYFLLMFRRVTDGKIITFERFNDILIGDPRQVVAMIKSPRCFVSYNGIRYDSVMIDAYLSNKTNAKLKEINDALINGGLSAYKARIKFNIKANPFTDHVDIMKVCPGVASLDVYAGRVYTKSLKFIPVDYDKPISDEQRLSMLEYCENDNIKTANVGSTLGNAIANREGLAKVYPSVDFRSMSDPMIAEKVYKIELSERGIEMPWPDGTFQDRKFIYRSPQHIEFKTESLKRVKKLFESSPITTSNKGKARIDFAHDENTFSHPKYKEEFKNSGFSSANEWRISKMKERYDDYVKSFESKKSNYGKTPLTPVEHFMKLAKGKHKVKVSQCEVTLGMGGIHSTEKAVQHRTDEDNLIFELDAAGYYPNLMIKNRYYPESIGPVFIEILDKIVKRRDVSKIALKLGGLSPDELLYHMGVNDGGKITANGTFGKTSDVFSILYDIYAMAHTTISGQLANLMLAEMLDLKGVHTVSANTDGIVVKCPRHLESVCMETARDWEEKTGYVLERTDYEAIYSQSVNSYIAVKTGSHNDCPNYSDNGYGVKGKGIFADTNDPYYLHRNNPKHHITGAAVKRWLLFGVPIEDTIRGCEEFRHFLTLTSVTGGAHYRGVNVGPVVRYYYSWGELDCIRRQNGYKVADTEGAVPCQDLPDSIPGDLDYGKYIQIAINQLETLGLKYE